MKTSSGHRVTDEFSDSDSYKFSRPRRENLYSALLFASLEALMQYVFYFAVYEAWWIQWKMLGLLNYAFVLFNIFLFFFFFLRRKYVISHAKTIEISGKEIVLESQQIIFLQLCVLRIHLRNDPQEATCEHCAILIYLFLTIR